MKYIIFSLLLILSVSSQSAPVCSKNGTTVIYTNGVTTKRKDADFAKEKIKALALNSQIDLKPEKVKYVLAYNYEESVAKDFLEAAVQRIPGIYLTKIGVTNPYAAFSSFYFGVGLALMPFQTYLTLMESLSDDFTQSLNNYLVTQKNNPIYIQTVNEIKQHYTDAFVRGERVFAISHSQGGLFMNDVYNLLEENDNKRKFFSGFQIATPLANAMDSHFGHATHDKDNLINFVRSTVGALGYNITAPPDLTNGISTAPNDQEQLKDFVIEYFLNHGILTTYLFNTKIKE
ncbi:MAG: hypothetical protein Q7U04_16200 [Bacteriovorax sp.]|nr:hypothetical protein [Bacteriovorax sp.]